MKRQKGFGEEYGADGVEISVHAYPAPDHADIQGRQFSIEEYDKLENGEIATDYQGNKYDGADKRHIGEYNCYHKIFSIVLGVSKPEYTEEQLKKIQENNIKGFEFEGKHYTMYQGSQLQRKIETAIRKQKDTQILARASGDTELIEQSQNKIRLLTGKYNDLCKTSGLLPKKQRMSVSGYKRTKVNNVNYNNYKIFTQDKNKFTEIGNKYFNFKSNKYLDEYVMQGNNIYAKMQKDENYKNKMYGLANKIDDLKEPIKENITLYSAQDKNFNLSESDFIIATTINKDIANFYKFNNRQNREIVTIYVEKGANIISTVNTTSKHFDRQGELIIPISEIKNLEKIDKYKYLLKNRR